MVARLVGDGFEAAWCGASGSPARTTTRTTRGPSLTDAPELVLELLVDQYDGWLDDDRPPTEPAAAGGAAGPARRARSGSSGRGDALLGSRS